MLIEHTFATIRGRAADTGSGSDTGGDIAPIDAALYVQDERGFVMGRTTTIERSSTPAPIPAPIPAPNGLTHDQAGISVIDNARSNSFAAAFAELEAAIELVASLDVPANESAPDRDATTGAVSGATSGPSSGTTAGATADPAIDVERFYAHTQRMIRRLQALQTTLFAEAQRRREELARRQRKHDPRVARQTQRQLQQDFQRRHRQTPSELHQLGRTAQRLNDAGGPVRTAFRAGTITGRHVQLIAETLHGFSGPARAELETELLRHAERTDARAFSQYCRRRIAELDADRAVAEQTARHERRALRMTTGSDAMLHLAGQLTGIDAETVATALDAFRQPDNADVPPEQRRAPEQITADAFVQLCQTALQHVDGTEHGSRPQIVVTIDYSSILAESGVANTLHTGPLPFGEVRRLLADAGVARILTDARSVPVEAGESVRTVPQGLWRSLVVRDQGCVADGCDAPPAWCDVAHLEQPFRFGGRLSVDNAALACRLHHRRFDLDRWKVTWRDRRPIIHHPHSPPTAGPPGEPRTTKASGPPRPPGPPVTSGATTHQRPPAPGVGPPTDRSRKGTDQTAAGSPERRPSEVYGRTSDPPRLTLPGL